MAAEFKIADDLPTLHILEKGEHTLYVDVYDGMLEISNVGKFCHIYLSKDEAYKLADLLMYYSSGDESEEI